MRSLAGLGCIIQAVLLTVLLTLGAMASNYLLNFWFSKDIPWYGDVIIGFIGSPIVLPGAFLTWLLHMFGAL